MDFVNLVFAETLGELETNVWDSEVQEFSLLEIAVDWQACNLSLLALKKQSNKFTF